MAMKTNNIIVKRFFMYALGGMLMAGLSDCKSTSNLKKSSKPSSSTSKNVISRAQNPTNYAITASALGGAAGSIIEKYMDRQVVQLNQSVSGIAQVERFGEGIKLIFNSAVLFKSDSSYALSSDPQPILQKLANSLATFKDTEILIAGHTDNVGTAKQNQLFSEKRAESLADFLQSNGVAQLRMVIQGFGEYTPKVSNGTENGRRQNERIELGIVANQTLKAQAKKEAAETSVSNK
jgi:outer membrane protein OmpA-like peptidoglycan-associated protein